MYNNNFKISILFILIFLISKEVFSYDSEKIVILCILSFLIIVYFNFKDALYQSFISKSTKLTEEYNDLINLKLKLEEEIREFLNIYKLSRNQIFQMGDLIMNNFISFLRKANKNRQLIVFHLTFF